MNECCYFNFKEADGQDLSDATTGGVQLWEDGPYWAECNVGAEKPEDAGLYFLWGKTGGFRFVDGKWIAKSGEMVESPFTDGNCKTHNKDRKWLRDNGYIDEDGYMTAEHDAATSRGYVSVGIHGVGTACAREPKAKGGLGTLLTIAKYDAENEIIAWKSFVVNGKRYKPDVWYTINENGKICEADDAVQSDPMTLVP